jgi:hypothetical protein
MREDFVMRSPEKLEIALIQLMEIKPPSFLPPHVLALAMSMRRKGLVVVDQDRWYPTALGLIKSGRSLH